MVGGSGSGTTKTSAPPAVAFISSTPPYWSAIHPGITYVGCSATFVPLRRIASYPAVNHAGSSSSTTVSLQYDPEHVLGAVPPVEEHAPTVYSDLVDAVHGALTVHVAVGQKLQRLLWVQWFGGATGPLGSAVVEPAVVVALQVRHVLPLNRGHDYLPAVGLRFAVLVQRPEMARQERVLRFTHRRIPLPG